MLYWYLGLVALNAIGNFTQLRAIEPAYSFGRMTALLVIETGKAAIFFALLFGLYLLGRKIFRSFRTSRT